MGRELRMVPPNWQHPKNDDGRYQPMYNRHIDDEYQEWLSEFDRIRSGDLDDIERECYAGEGKIPLLEWLHDKGTPPNPTYYRPWRDEEATWFQVWETVSEGTPVTPPFATREELVDYLATHGDFSRQRWNEGPFTRAQAEAFVKMGWAPSMMAFVQDGVCTKTANGIEIPELLERDK